MSKKAIDAGVRMGHVHLKVADLERAIGFYSGVLGFEVMQRFGSSAAFLSAGGYHHHIGLNTWESAGGAAPAAGTLACALRLPEHEPRHQLKCHAGQLSECVREPATSANPFRHDPAPIGERLLHIEWCDTPSGHHAL